MTRLAKLRLSCLALCAGLFFALGAVPVRASAQVIRGTIRAAVNLEPIESARITLLSRDGTVLGTATSDPLGAYAMRAPNAGPYKLQARRLGFDVMEIDVKALALSDTAEFEFLMTVVAASMDAVTVSAPPTLNERRLEEAHRRGWRVYEPELVAQHRERARDLFQLLRSIGTTGLVLPRNANDCIRTLRNDRCLTYVVDNQVLGTTASVLPSDIHFIAVLSASEARIQFGDRAAFGAIAIYTRARSDRAPRRRPLD